MEQKKVFIKLIPPNTYTAERIRYIRKSNKLTQKLFATLLGVASPTVADWESGRYAPKGSSSRLLELLESHQIEIVR